MERVNLLIADLDGTLIKTISGRNNPQGIYDMEFKFDVLEAIKKANPNMLYIITNQGGIEKGFVKDEYFRRKIEYIRYALMDYLKIPVNYSYCPTMNKNDVNRKPNCGMIYDALDYYHYRSGYNLDENTKILMIGDASGLPGQFSDSDRKTVINANHDFLASPSTIDYMDVHYFTKKYSE